MQSKFPEKPAALTIAEAVAKLPTKEAVRVVQQSAITTKPDTPHVWHRDFAADKIRSKGAERTYDGAYGDFGMFFTDENGDRFYIETQPE